jgi:hypothetical protein
MQEFFISKKVQQQRVGYLSSTYYVKHLPVGKDMQVKNMMYCISSLVIVTDYFL